MSIPHDIAFLVGDNAQPITFESIAVQPPQLRSSRLFGSHHVYPIVSTPQMEEMVYRRYSEFEWIYNTLVSQFPGVFVPPIPPKKALGNQSEGFIESQRRPALERFLNRVSKIPILAESQAFQAFMCRINTFADAQKEISKKLSSRTPDQLFSLYNYYFADIIHNDVPHSIDMDFDSLYSFLKQKEKECSDLANASHDMHQALLKQAKALEKMLAVMEVAKTTDAQNEQFTINNPTKKLPVQFSFQCWSQYLTELEPSYNNHLYLSYVYELEDIQAFLSLLTERKTLRSKHAKSLQKVHNWDAPGTQCSTEKQLTQRANDIQQEQVDSKLLSMVTTIQWFYEWPVFYMKYVDEYNAMKQNFSVAQHLYSNSTYHEFSSLAGTSTNSLASAPTESATAAEFLNDESQ